MPWPPFYAPTFVNVSSLLCLQFDDSLIHLFYLFIYLFFWKKKTVPETLLTKDLELHFIQLLNAQEPGSAMLPGEPLSPLHDCMPRQLSHIESSFLTQVASLCQLLPRSNYILLHTLFSHLTRVTSKESLNKMGVSNLQVVFAPTLAIPNVLLGLFLTHTTRVLSPVKESGKRDSMALQRSATVSSSAERRSSALMSTSPAGIHGSPSPHLPMTLENPFDSPEEIEARKWELPPAKPARSVTVSNPRGGLPSPMWCHNSHIFDNLLKSLPL